MFLHLILAFVLNLVISMAGSNAGNTLKAGNSLKQGDYIVSDNGVYYARMQSDGNFVIYISNDFRASNAIWSTRTSHKSGFYGPYTLDMQDDGNLVIYDTHRSALWSSKTAKNGSKPHQLVMQSDANLVLYDGDRRATWSSRTARSRSVLD